MVLAELPDGHQSLSAEPALGPKGRIVSADNQDAKRVVSSEEGALPVVPRDGAKARIDRRRLVATGLTAPVILTLGSRSAQAASGTASKMASVHAARP
jgi:hypothetical protein